VYLHEAGRCKFLHARDETRTSTIDEYSSREEADPLNLRLRPVWLQQLLFAIAFSCRRIENPCIFLHSVSASELMEKPLSKILVRNIKHCIGSLLPFSLLAVVSVWPVPICVFRDPRRKWTPLVQHLHLMLWSGRLWMRVVEDDVDDIVKVLYVVPAQKTPPPLSAALYLRYFPHC